MGTQEKETTAAEKWLDLRPKVLDLHILQGSHSPYAAAIKVLILYRMKLKHNINSSRSLVVDNVLGLSRMVLVSLVYGDTQT